MKLMDMTCPHCGAKLQYTPGERTVKCEYCDSVMMIDSPVQEQPRQAPQPPVNNPGYYSRAFYPENNNVRNVNTSSGPKHIWLWVLGFMFMIPIPLTVIVAKSKLSKLVKGILITVIWALYLIFAYYGND